VRRPILDLQFGVIKGHLHLRAPGAAIDEKEEGDLGNVKDRRQTKIGRGSFRVNECVTDFLFLSLSTLDTYIYKPLHTRTHHRRPSTLELATSWAKMKEV